MGHILSILSSFIVNTISSLGYFGVAILMAIESANIPLPSEVIMPFSGFLIFAGKFSLLPVAVAGGIGCLAGSLFSYWLGAIGGRPLIEKYGKYILMSHHDLDLTDRWFKKWGNVTVFIGRLLPVVRTFISFPAGIARVNLWTFSLYTLVGSIIWSYFLAWVGMKLGENWDSLKGYFHRFDLVIGILIIAGIVWWVWRHIKHSRKSA